MDKDAQKREAGRSAANLVKDGMVVGLGTGSTVHHTIVRLGERVREGLRVKGIPTSIASEKLAREVGVPLTTLDEHPRVDLTIDGADEFDGKLNLIKGGGGALTREKIVAKASRRMVVVADAAKEVRDLGSTFALPVEVIELGKTPILDLLRRMGADARVRTTVDGSIYRTDNGNPIIDAKFPRIAHPDLLERDLETYPGVVSCGLFVGLCQEAHVAGPGGVRVIKVG